MNRRGFLIAPLLAALLPGPVSYAAEHLVIIKDFSFQPQEITIQKGDTVRWENHEKRQYHSVWFEELGEPEPDYFFPEESFERTFDDAGDLPYRCGPHPKMTGTVHVLN
jgi:plastocyanin